MTAEIHEAVESLLHGDDFGKVNDLQELLQLLEPTTTATISTTPNKTPRTPHHHETISSLRQILGANADDLKEHVCTLMMNRVELDDLLPMTFDDEANEDAMNDQHALTLTQSAMLAAQVYAKVLAHPGAFSAGWVELYALSELSRILARWRTECTGREMELCAQTSQKYQQSLKRVRTNSTEELSDSESGSEDVDDDEESSGVVMQEIGGENFLTPRKLIVLGMQVALQVSEIPMQKHFSTWSKDCRSSIMDAVSSSLATTAALFKHGRRQDKNVDAELASVANNVMERASKALSHCLMADPSMSTETAVEMIIDVQRNLYSYIVLKENSLPNGEDGQMAVAQVASNVFQTLSSVVTSFATGNDDDEDAESQSSPRSPQSIKKVSTAGSTTPSSTTTSSTQTSTKAKMRRSMGASPTPVKLKNRDSMCSPQEVSERRASFVADPKRVSLHPALQKIVSMMQKLLTDPKNGSNKVRDSACSAVEQCLLGLTHKGVLDLVLKWIVKVFNSNSDFHRLAAVRLAGFVIKHDSLSKGIGTDGSNDFNGKLFDGLQGRLYDQKQPVRMAAANEFISMFEYLKESDDEMLLRNLQVQAEKLAELFRSLALEESTIAAKITFIKALVSILLHSEKLTILVVAEDVEALVATCQDTKSVMLRAAAADGLTALLDGNYAGKMEAFIVEQWSQTILPLALEPELKVYTKAFQLIDQIILDPILEQQGSSVGSDKASRRAWSILSAVGNRSVQLGASRAQFDALRSAVSKRTDAIKLLRAVQQVGTSILDDDMTETCNYEAGVWCLFGAIMEHKDDVKELASLLKRNTKTSDGFDFAVRSYFALFDTRGQSSVHQLTARYYCLQVLGRLSFCCDLSLAPLRSHLEKTLLHFSLDASYIAAAVRLYIASILSSSESEQDGTTQCKQSMRNLFTRCEETVHALADTRLSTSDESKLSRALCTVGELRLVGFVSDDTSGKKDTAWMIARHDINMAPSDKLCKAILALADSSLFTELIRGHALVVLGKMCLRDETLAQDSIGIFVQALGDMERPIVRSNALLCMGDMIVRYTNLADRFLPEMAACLQAGVGTGKDSSHILTRKHAVLVLSDLLLQDYIKWRGLLFHRFLVATRDKDEEVALLAEQMLCGPLKKEKLFSSHFVESLFVLNGCTDHDMFRTAERHGDGGSGLSVDFNGVDLTGQKGRAQRESLYALMLSQMAEEEKIAATAGIVKDIFARCLQQGSELNQACVTADEQDTAYNLLQDVFLILSSKAIRPGRAAADDGDSELMPKKAALHLKVRGALMSKVSRKHLLEHMLPTLIQLKDILRSNRSRLVQSLMDYFVVIYRLYPDEVKDNLLVKHPTLLQEIQFDAKKTRDKSKK